jgi:hypothetical protein
MNELDNDLVFGQKTKEEPKVIPLEERNRKLTNVAAYFRTKPVRMFFQAGDIVTLNDLGVMAFQGQIEPEQVCIVRDTGKSVTDKTEDTSIDLIVHTLNPQGKLLRVCTESRFFKLNKNNKE